jgi:hypothetical protein
MFLQCISIGIVRIPETRKRDALLQGSGRALKRGKADD